MRKAFYILLLPFLLIACDNDEDNNCTYYDYSTIIGIETGVDTVRVRQDLPMRFDIRIANNCGEFSRLNIEKNNFVWNIDAVTLFEGCECSGQSYEITYPDDFIFRGQEIGTYQLNFNNYEGQIIQRTIVVTQ